MNISLDPEGYTVKLSKDLRNITKLDEGLRSITEHHRVNATPICELMSILKKAFKSSPDPLIANIFAKATFYGDNRQDLPKVSIPSLILQCTDDTIAPMEVGYYLNENLSDSTLAIMKATGHCPHMSHPQETINLIHEYLQN